MQTNLRAYLSNKHFLSLTGNVVISFTSIVSASVIFRSLNVADVGRWIFFISLLGLVDSVRSGFITTAFIRACAGATPARAAEVSGSAWHIALLITLAFGALNAGAALVPTAYVSAELELFIRWFGLTLLATLPGFMAGCALQADMRFDQLLYLRLISQGLFTGGVIVLMLTKTATLERIVYLNLFRECVCSGSALLLGWGRLRSLGRRTRACTRELFHFGKYSIGSYIGTMLARNTDTFIINFSLGPAALAVYNLAGRFMEIIEIPLRSAIATAVPALSAAYNQHDHARLADLLRRNAGVVTVAILPLIVGIFAFADVLVAAVGGGKYLHTEAPAILRIFIVMAVIFPIDRFFGVALDVTNQPKINLFKVLLMFGVNLVGDFAGVWLLGNIYGIALSSVAAMVVGFVYGYLVLTKSIRVTVREILGAGLDEARKVARTLWARLSLTKPM